MRRVNLPCLVLILALACLSSVSWGKDKAKLSFEELMKFRQIEGAVISDDGRFVAYGLEPDRGDGEGVVRSTDGKKRYAVELGESPIITSDGKWVAMKIGLSLEARESEDEDEDEDEDKPKPQMALLSTEDGEVSTFEEVQSFAFSDDGKWLAYHRYVVEEDEDEADAEDEGEESTEATESGDGDEEDEEEREAGGVLVLRYLADGEELEIADVGAYAFDEPSLYLAYTRKSLTGEGNGL